MGGMDFTLIQNYVYNDTLSNCLLTLPDMLKEGHLSHIRRDHWIHMLESIFLLSYLK